MPEAPDVEPEFVHIIDSFWLLNNCRAHNGFTLQPMSWTEFKAWQHGTGNLLTVNEELIVMHLFSVFDQAANEMKPKTPKS